MKLTLVLLLGAFGLLSACGLKGDLYLENTAAGTTAAPSETETAADTDAEDDDTTRKGTTPEDTP